VRGSTCVSAKVPLPRQSPRGKAVVYMLATRRRSILYGKQPLRIMAGYSCLILLPQEATVDPVARSTVKNTSYEKRIPGGLDASTFAL